MKNIAILIPQLHTGGAERSAGTLSKYLALKYKVYIFITDINNIVYDYSGILVDISINGEAKIEATMREFKRIYKIDCAISFLEQMNLMNIRTKEDELVIISERSSIGELYPYPEGRVSRINKWYNLADKIVTVAKGVEYDLEKNYGIKSELITTIYNFINKQSFLKKSEDLIEEDISKFIGKSRLILNVGRLHPQKNQRKLIFQFSKLVKEGYDIKLIILGSGILEKELNQLIEEFQLTDRIRLISYCANPFPYYKKAYMMVLSSDWEGLPNVIIESMVLKLPVVAVDCISGPRELLKGSSDYGDRTKGIEICERGILVEKCSSDQYGNTDYLAKAMSILLDNSILRSNIIKNSWDYINKYSNEKIEKQWIDVIENTRKSPMPSAYIPELEGYKKVIVYGAGIYGKIAMSYLLEYYQSELDLLCFAVSSKNNNSQMVLSVPVYEIQNLVKYKEEAIVVIAVSVTYEEQVKIILNKLGFKYIYLLF